MMAPLPPGIGSSGINDYGRVVETHRLALESQSYRVELVHREFRNGTMTGVSRQTVRVENATRYSATRVQSGTFVDGPSRLVGETVYANGTALFERTSTGVERQPIVDGDVYLRRHTQYLGYYLSVEDSTVVDYQMDPSGSLIRLTTDGDPWPGVQNASGNVVVTGTGVVVQVWRAYDVPGSDVRVVVTLHVSDVGETTVTTPAWVDGS